MTKKSKNRINLNDLPPLYQQQIKRKLASGSQDTGTSADSEQHRVDPAKGKLTKSQIRRDLVQRSKEQVQGAFIQGPVRIVATFFCKRLPDFDGLLVKWPIDSLVEARVLFDDKPKYVKAVQKEYVKVDERSEEQVILRVYRWEDPTQKELML